MASLSLHLFLFKSVVGAWFSPTDFCLPLFLAPVESFSVQTKGRSFSSSSFWCCHCLFLDVFSFIISSRDKQQSLWVSSRFNCTIHTHRWVETQIPFHLLRHRLCHCRLYHVVQRWDSDWLRLKETKKRWMKVHNTLHLQVFIEFFVQSFSSTLLYPLITQRNVQQNNYKDNVAASVTE